MKKILPLIFTLLLFNLAFSQKEDSIQTVEIKYQNYFKLQYETVYTHINKSTFVNNEELWFKVYVYNTKTQKPYISTTNIYVGIYDITGTLISKKTYRCENGTTAGNFKIDASLPPGTYFLKTDTNWMKNFNEDHSNIQKFTVFGEERKKQEIVKKTYDFQFLPEGGHIISEVDNNVGFKIIDNFGNSVKVAEGEIRDRNNTLITAFKSNYFGIGKFRFSPKENMSYEAILTLENGEKIKKPITDISETGITIGTKTLRENLIISIKTNKKTLPSLLNKNYYLLIHRDGTLKRIKVLFEKNKFDYTLSINANEMLPGINIITLFNNNNKPIVERMVFNHKQTPIKEIEIASIVKNTDSSTITLNTKSNSKHSSLSVSVLPQSTKSYTYKNTILSTFLLKPYLKGYIENPSYYFKNSDRETLYNLDLLLLTQGWSKYAWKNIFHSIPIPTNNFEKGFTIKGTLNNTEYDKNNSVVLISKENNLILEAPLDKDNRFTFSDLHLKDSSSINISVKNKKNKFLKPKVYYTVSPRKTIDFIDITKFTDIVKNDNQNTLSEINNELLIEGNLIDEVEIKMKRKEPLKNNPIGTSFGAKNIKFSEDDNQFGLVTDIIRNNGFEVQNNGSSVLIESRRVRNASGALKPLVRIDNINMDDLSVLATMVIGELEEIFISNNGSMYGSAGAGGVINIFTKKSINGTRKKSLNTFHEKNISFGFTDSKEYYSPLYIMSHNTLFSSYGVLNWVPNITKNAMGNYFFKIPNYTYEKVNVYIEGMAEDGSLISKTETIKL